MRFENVLLILKSNSSGNRFVWLDVVHDPQGNSNDPDLPAIDRSWTPLDELHFQSGRTFHARIWWQRQRKKILINTKMKFVEISEFSMQSNLLNTLWRQIWSNNCIYFGTIQWIHILIQMVCHVSPQWECQFRQS